MVSLCIQDVWDIKHSWFALKKFGCCTRMSSSQLVQMDSTFDEKITYFKEDELAHSSDEREGFADLSTQEIPPNLPGG